jgi:hydroxymethylpyrimidine pyrophosphatase-like HAD family hydrolase
LRRLKRSGRRLLLVTGRQLEDLQGAFPELEICDLVVAENGALLFRPPDGPATPLAPPPPTELMEELERRGVRFTTGRSVIATARDFEQPVLEAIGMLALDVQMIFNKEALMLLPAGVDKRSGLLAALGQLQLSPEQVVGVGDGENDLPFLRACGRSVVVANAVPTLRDAADVVTAGERGEGVRELIDQLLSDPRSVPPADRGPLEPLPDEVWAP